MVGPVYIAKEKQMITAMNKRAIVTTQKYSIKISRNKIEANKINTTNHNRFLQDAVDKEMAATDVAFKFMEERESPPDDLEYVSFCLFFDI